MFRPFLVLILTYKIQGGIFGPQFCPSGVTSSSYARKKESKQSNAITDAFEIQEDLPEMKVEIKKTHENMNKQDWKCFLSTHELHECDILTN